MYRRRVAFRLYIAILSFRPTKACHGFQARLYNLYNMERISSLLIYQCDHIK